MKSTLCSALLKTALLIVPLSLSFRGPTIAQAGDRNPLFPDPVRSGNLDYRTELPGGSLIVYSATDAFDDGGVLYYPHSSYAVYTIDGKLFKKVENHISRSDEIPEVVALPVGSYVIEARSEKDGDVFVRVVIKEGRRTTLDLDSGQKDTLTRSARAKDWRRLGGSAVAQGGDKDPLFPGPVRPGTLDYRTELQQGYLKVYSATDEFKDGDDWYFPHSSYAIYTTDGKLFKKVENHISRSDEIPEVVVLPVGFYTVVARAENDGYVRVPVVISKDQRRILDLDLWERKTLSRFAHN
jgi:hypothetical protein